MQVSLSSQSQSTHASTEKLRNIEKELFVVDRKMSDYVDNLKNAQEAFDLQAEIDKERLNFY